MDFRDEGKTIRWSKDPEPISHSRKTAHRGSRVATKERSEGKKKGTRESTQKSEPHLGERQEGGA